MKLVIPAEEFLSSYVAALERGWSPDNLRPQTAHDELAAIARDASAFLKLQDDREGRGPPVVLPDGSVVPRLPGYRRWIWDGEFCGVIGFRWQPGTAQLPSYCLGHIGFSVVPWKRRNGYATRALALLLPEAAREGLEYVELTTDPTNVGSQAVITRNGGVLVETFAKDAAYGGADSLRFRIPLNGMVVRRARLNDVPALFTIRTSVRENHLDLDQLAARGVTQSSVAAMLDDPNACIWVAEHANAVVAFSMADARSGGITAVFVDPAHEGRGFGRAVLRAAEQWLFGKGWKKIGLQTDEAPHTRAHSFYQKSGWTRGKTADHGDVRYEKQRAAD